MKNIFDRAKRFFNVQYRLTFRAALTGLLASGERGEQAIRLAHEHTVLSLQQYQKSEI